MSDGETGLAARGAQRWGRVRAGVRRRVGRGLMVAGMRATAHLRRDVVAEPSSCPAGWQAAPPDFVGVGVYRSGTSWWYRMVLGHPAVEGVRGARRRLRRGERLDPNRSVPALSARPLGKELRFFDPFVEEPFLPPHSELYREFFPRPEGSIAGEWSPNYMSDFWIPALIAHAAPDARLLVMLRDPVERLRSTLAFVDTAVQMQGTRQAVDVWNTERDRGRYMEQMTRLLRHFDRERILVLQYERCRQDPMGELRRTHEFLGLEPLDRRPEGLDERFAGSRRAKPELREDVRRQLVLELEEDVRELADRFPEVNIELWPNFDGGTPSTG